jgi:hypothetical protein
MKTLLTTLTTFLCFGVFSQTPFPYLDDFSSLSQPGDKFTLITGQPNTGSHGGFLCYNVSGNYIDNEYYSFESDTLDLSLWTEVEVIVTVASSLRNGDVFAFWHYNPADGWAGVDLSNLIGTYTFSIPITTTLVSVDLNTNTNGNVNNKYAHMDRLEMNDPGGTPLPIELISFEGHDHEGCNHLDWATASEANTDYYDVEWSRDAYVWESIGILPAAGNSNMTLYYNFVDESPLSIVNYYRLVQYDWDGMYEIFGPIAIDNRKREKRIVKYVNISGQEVDPQYTTGLVIGILEDGTYIKVYLK